MANVFLYADYDSYSGAEKLSRLRQHMAEVRQHLLGMSTRGNSVTPLPPNYLRDLKTEEAQLVAQSQLVRMQSNKAKFEQE